MNDIAAATGAIAATAAIPGVAQSVAFIRPRFVLSPEYLHDYRSVSRSIPTGTARSVRSSSQSISSSAKVWLSA